MYEAYNEAMVQLGDDYLKEMYMNLMLVYMGEHTAEVLARCRIGEVTDAVLGFAESALNKMGTLLARHTRLSPSLPAKPQAQAFLSP